MAQFPAYFSSIILPAGTYLFFQKLCRQIRRRPSHGSEIAKLSYVYIFRYLSQIKLSHSKGSQDWNSPPSGLKVVKSTSTFKTHLKDHIKQQYFMSIFIDLYVLVSCMLCCACVGIFNFFENICVDFCILIMQDSQGDQPLADETFPVEN